VEFVDCPTCASPAEVESSSKVFSTDGPVELVKISCVRRHWFLLPRDMLASPSTADGASPSSAPTAIRWVS